MSGDRLLDYITDKYGVGNAYAVNHYETTAESDLGAGIIVNEGTPFSMAINNFDYEDGINEAKRRIKVLSPVYVNQVVAEYNKIFN